MPGQVNGDAIVTQTSQFGNGALPAPRRVKTTVYEDESHRLLVGDRNGLPWALTHRLADQRLVLGCHILLQDV